MVRSDTRWLRGAAIGVVATLALSACGGSTATSAPPATSAPAVTAAPGATAAPPTAEPTAAGPAKGGTIYILTQSEQWNQVDPQRAYTGEDMAFFSATIYRSLTAYKLSADPTEGTSLTPDLATDIGTATDGGKTWAFTLRDGVTLPGRLADHLRGRQVRRLADVRDRRHQPGPDLRDRVPRHPERRRLRQEGGRQGREVLGVRVRWSVQRHPDPVLR